MAIEARKVTERCLNVVGQQVLTFGSPMSTTPQVILLFASLSDTDSPTAFGLAGSCSFGMVRPGSNQLGLSGYFSQKNRDMGSDRALIWGTAGRANFVSATASGFTLDWVTVPATRQYFQALALGGLTNHYSAAVIPGGTGQQSFTGFGFQPTGYLITTITSITTAETNVVHSIAGIGWTDGTTQFAMGNAFSTSAAEDRAQSSGKVVYCPFTGSIRADASHVSMDADGVTIDFGSTSPWAYQIFAWEGSAEVGVDTAPVTTGSTQINTSVDPAGGLFGTFGLAATPDVSTKCIYSMGAFDTASSVAFGATADAASNVRSQVDTTKVLKILDIGSSIGGTAEITNISSGTIDLDWVKSVGSAQEYGYLIFGDTVAPPSGIPPTVRQNANQIIQGF